MIGVASVLRHEISDIDLADAGAAIDRRADGGVVEIGSGAVDLGLVLAHLRVVGGDGCALRVGLLRGAVLGFHQLVVAREITLRVGEGCRVLRLLGDSLVVGGLVGARIDAREHVAHVQILTFAETYFHDRAAYHGTDIHRVQRLHRPNAVECHRHVGTRCLCSQDRDGCVGRVGRLRLGCLLVAAIPDEAAHDSDDDDDSEDKAFHACSGVTQPPPRAL